MQYFSATPYRRSADSLARRLHRQTYQCLRLVMATVAIALPLVLLVSAKFLPSSELDGMPRSISGFYHSEMRDVFVGAIFAIGMCLYAYKGYNNLENTCLTVAGVFLFGVALAPTKAPTHSSNWVSVVHYTSAACFFGLIAVVCIFARNHGLQTTDVGHEGYKTKYATAYNITATLMILVLAIGLAVFLFKREFPRATLFWLETFAVWVFAGYWCVKTRELRGLE